MQTAENGRADGDSKEGDEEAEAERRRRRRGRRGGRNRPRREGGTAEPGFEEPLPAADTVEILPVPEPAEAESAFVEARTIWPAEVTLSRSRQPQANSSSATSTANGAPTAQPTMPTARPASVNTSSSV